MYLCMHSYRKFFSSFFLAQTQLAAGRDDDDEGGGEKEDVHITQHKHTHTVFSLIFLIHADAGGSWQG